MIVQVQNVDRKVTNTDVMAQTCKWFSANVMEGQLITGETFRAWTSPAQWAAFMA